MTIVVGYAHGRILSDAASLIDSQLPWKPFESSKILSCKYSVEKVFSSWPRSRSLPPSTLRPLDARSGVSVTKQFISSQSHTHTHTRDMARHGTARHGIDDDGVGAAVYVGERQNPKSSSSSSSFLLYNLVFRGIRDGRTESNLENDYYARQCSTSLCFCTWLPLSLFLVKLLTQLHNTRPTRPG